jgi:hypothetical protein
MFLGRQGETRSAKGVSRFRRPVVAQRRNQAFHSALLRVAPFSLLLVFVACGTTLPVTHRPASELRLEIIIGDQFSVKPNVSVSVHVHDETNQREVALADNTKVTCGGTDISENAKPIPFIRQTPYPFWALVPDSHLEDRIRSPTPTSMGHPRRRPCLSHPAHSLSLPHPQARRSPSRLTIPLLCASYCQLHHWAEARASTTSC